MGGAQSADQRGWSGNRHPAAMLLNDVQEVIFREALDRAMDALEGEPTPEEISEIDITVANKDLWNDWINDAASTFMFRSADRGKYFGSRILLASAQLYRERGYPEKTAEIIAYLEDDFKDQQVVLQLLKQDIHELMHYGFSPDSVYHVDYNRQDIDF